jgi:hypothetical protein
MKISKAELKKLEKQGVQVKRQMGKQPPKTEVAPPKKKVEKPKPAPAAPSVDHAAMRASIDHSARIAEKNSQVIEQNSKVIKEFTDNIERLEPYEPQDYTFDLERDDDKLLKRIYARVGILE